MKRLNKKGFTLVELLAIIVILAVILVITVPQVFKAVDNSKKSSLESSASAIVKWYNTTKAADALVSDANDKVLSGYTATTTKTCLDTAFFTAAEVNANDFIVKKDATDTTVTVANGCSFYWLNGTAVEFVLVAKTTGKFYVASAVGTANNYKYMWANSNGANSWTGTGTTTSYAS